MANYNNDRRSTCYEIYNETGRKTLFSSIKVLLNTKFFTRITILLILFYPNSILFSQINPIKSDSLKTNIEINSSIANVVQTEQDMNPIELSPSNFLNQTSFWLTIVIVFFGLLIIIITVIALHRKLISLKSSEYLRLVSIILIITASLILIVAGYR